MEDKKRKKGSKHEQRGAEYPSPPAQGTGRGSSHEMTHMQERASLVVQSPASTTPSTHAFPCFVAYEEARSPSHAVNFSSVAVLSNNYQFFSVIATTTFLSPGFKYVRKLLPFFYMDPTRMSPFSAPSDPLLSFSSLATSALGITCVSSFQSQLLSAFFIGSNNNIIPNLCSLK